MTPDPADLAREPNADYWRGVREERERHSSQCEPHTCECHRRGVPQLNATDAGSECGACAEREGWRQAKEVLERAASIMLREASVLRDRPGDGLASKLVRVALLDGAREIDKFLMGHRTVRAGGTILAIRNLPEEPERNAK
jgi:hypothetical protein